MKTPTKKDFLNDLYLFYRLFIASNYKDDVPAPHIKQLSRKLMALRNGEGKSRIAVSMPPRHSKSSMVTLAFPLWLIFQNPDVHIMIVTGSPKLSDKFGIQLREYVRELGPYFNVYLSDVKQASTHLMFCDANKKLYKGNLILASSGGGITGQDADYLIVDDPYRGNDDEFTPSALQKKIDWANRVIEQRIEPHTKYDLSDDTPVYTSNRGWTTHGDLKVGDILIGSNRKKTRIIKVHPKTSCDNCLVFSNGDKIVCGNEHLWKLYDNENNITRLFTTREVMERQLIKENTYESTFTIPVSKSKCINLIDAYKIDEPKPSNCITVEAHDGIYLVGRHFTPTHNCILHTRWHSRDLIGYYKEEDPESYDFIEFPALDENEEPLWKERYSKEELLKKKQVVGERVFQSVYQQQPIDTTSDFFNIQRLKFGLPTGFDEQSVCRAWDIASSGVSNNDYTAGAKLQRYDDYCVISDLVYGQFGGETPKVIQHTAEADTPTCHIVVETGVAAAGQLLYQEWKKQLPGFFVEQAKVSGGKSKVDRATPFKNAVEDGKVYINISNPEIRQAIMDELNSFPNGHHDDITDAISHGYNYLFMNEDATKKATAKMRVIHI